MYSGTMRTRESVPVANMPMMLPLACLLSEASATASIFTGKERDTESGNDYFGARYYASTMGRWLSPDWSVKIEPVPYAKLDNPQSLNLYSYVFNNPLTLLDPDGHEIDLNGQQWQKDEEQRRVPHPSRRLSREGWEDN